MPPFARDFVRRPQDSPWIFAGPLAWEWARHDSRRKLVLPPDDNPASYKWPVADLELMVLETGASDDVLLDLSHELLLAGAILVGMIPLDTGRGFSTFRQDIHHVAAA